MKITGYESAILNITEEDPPPTLPGGAGGRGVTLGAGRLGGSLRAAVDELAALTIGEDPLRIEKIIARLRDAAGSPGGPGGIFTLALAAIDIALWDINARAAEQPLWK